MLFTTVLKYKSPHFQNYINTKLFFVAVFRLNFSFSQHVTSLVNKLQTDECILQKMIFTKITLSLDKAKLSEKKFFIFSRISVSIFISIV